MVSRGFVPQKGVIPAPDLSFVRLFDDPEPGWQYRGQYAIWTGVGLGVRSRYLLLERIGNRVAPIEYSDGRPVFHQIAAGTPFLVQGLVGYWLTFDSDAVWLDTPSPDGQYSFLAVGGAAGKPSSATVDWTCPSCGHAVSPKKFALSPQTFKRFLRDADTYAQQFNEDTAFRTCSNCAAVHPSVGTGQQNEEDEATDAPGK